MKPELLKDLLAEANELLAIFATSQCTAKKTADSIADHPINR
jgi:hypothetical protein